MSEDKIYVAILSTGYSSHNVTKDDFREMAYRSIKNWFELNEAKDIIVQEIEDCPSFTVKAIPDVG